MCVSLRCQAQHILPPKQNLLHHQHQPGLAASGANTWPGSSCVRGRGPSRSGSGHISAGGASGGVIASAGSRVSNASAGNSSQLRARDLSSPGLLELDGRRVGITAAFVCGEAEAERGSRANVQAPVEAQVCQGALHGHADEVTRLLTNRPTESANHTAKLVRLGRCIENVAQPQC